MTLFFPVAFFILVELFLRLMHYGPDISLFTSVTIGGKTFRVMNPGVGNRYFSRTGFNPSTSADVFESPKPHGTYRIFCLGGSTTVGYPYWYNGAFSSFLRDRLSRIFPDRRIEVINVGMTATNSFTVLDMASDIVDQEPDLLIVYDGHNEFYGALGVASRESWGGSRWMTRLALRLVHIRTVYLVREAISGIRSWFHGEDEHPNGTMMERLASGKYIPYGSTMYAEALSEFIGNIRDLKSLCADRNVPLILSTQVSNVRDLPPFFSGALPGTSPQTLSHFNALINDAMALTMDGRGDSALTLYYQAVEMDPLRAETRYDLGQCLEKLGKTDEALHEYTLARDYDQLRFRTSSDFNDAIRTAAGRTFVADIEKDFMGASRDSLVGNDLLFEHVHPRSRGTFLVARCYAAVMRAHGLLAPEAEWREADTIVEASLWQDRPLTDLDERIAQRRNDILLSGWPFQPVDRPPHEIFSRDTLELITDSVVMGELGWDEGHRSAASYEERRGDTTNAAAEYRLLLKESLLLSGEFGEYSAVSGLPYSAAKNRYLSLERRMHNF